MKYTVSVTINGEETFTNLPAEEANRVLELLTALHKIDQIRQALNKENISYSQLAKLKDLVPYIAKDDVQMLEAAGVPENSWRGYTFKDFQEANPELSEKEAEEHFSRLMGLPQ